MKTKHLLLLAVAFGVMLATAMAAPHENLAFVKVYDHNGYGQGSFVNPGDRL